MEYNEYKPLNIKWDAHPSTRNERRGKSPAINLHLSFFSSLPCLMARGYVQTTWKQHGNNDLGDRF